MDLKQGVIIVGLVAVAGALIGANTAFDPDSVETISEKWDRSTHSDFASESFTHWDEDDPPVVPASCTKCHSTYGYLDYLGEDGSDASVVDSAAKTGSVVFCSACHNDNAHALTEVVFPSGATVAELGSEARCMVCHQGRQSTDQVTESLAGLPEDTVDENLGFINVHYAIAAATQAGGDARSGFQYPGWEYVGRYEHVPNVETCVECHDPHSQAVEPDACSPCHVSVSDYVDIRSIRKDPVDYDGDGDTDEGIRLEIIALEAGLYAAMQSYADTVIGTAIIYTHTFPYFFIDTNANGTVDSDEVNFGNQYPSWTPRLVKAAYNYHFAQEDPGKYAHNAKYVMQLLYDSIEDLAQEGSGAVGQFVRPASAGADGGASR